MAGAEFLGARAEDVEFVDCDLTGAEFSQFRARRVRFQNCTLDGLGGVTDLRGCTIASPDLLAVAGNLAGALGIILEL